MLDRTYTPQPGSLASQIVGFFQNNPNEELGLEDITAKFGTVRGNIHTMLRTAVDAALLERDRNPDGDYIYKPGKALPKPSKGVDIDAAHASRAKATKANRAPTPAPSGYSSPRVEIDFDTLQVDEGVPLPFKSKRGENKWQPLFDKLTKAGQSVALPSHMRGAAGAAATKINRLKTQGAYRVAMVEGEKCRVFRTA